MKIITNRFRRVVGSQKSGAGLGRINNRTSLNKTTSTNFTRSKANVTGQLKKLTWTQYLRLSLKFAKLAYKAFVRKHRLLSRIIAVLLVLFLLFAIFYEVQKGWEQTKPPEYNSAIEDLIGKPITQYAEKLTENKKGGYDFNKDYSLSEGFSGQSSGPKVIATFESGKTGKVSVTDPVNKVDLALIPKFAVGSPKKQSNRIIYKLDGKNASTIYSAKGSGIKEDIILHNYIQDEMSFEYEISLASGTEARLENDGSIGVYGVNSALLGNVSTGSEKDAELLQKARENSEKKTILFTIPKPVVLEGKRKVSKSATAIYTLEGKLLQIKAKGLKGATYPLSIDPTIYVETAAKLMRGNNESNTDFDVTNELIEKSQTTGARIDAWSSTTNLSSAVYGQGTAVAGGYIYSAGGVGSAVTTTTTYNTAGSSTFVVPAGVTSVTVKSWGAGGGGGGGDGNSALGGAGGGGGYAKAVLTVTPAETLDVLVGTGGAKATVNTAAGNGGGYSAVKRGATFLLQAGGGGGGGGTRGTRAGGAGGAGGGASGVAGSSPASGGGGGGAGTNAAGGAAGAAGAGGAAGRAGIANAGGNGMASVTSCATSTAGTGGAGGTGAGGSGGVYVGAVCSNGGGGGGGRFGGGGGGTTNSNNRGGGGGGGGSDLVTGSSTVETAGSGTTPGNSGDSDIGGLADGGAGATTAASAVVGDSGIITISYTTAGTVTSGVYWAKFNSSTRAITSPNPGNGVCTGWCNNSAYNLPTALQGLSLVAYNGFLYAIGGATSAGTPQTTVYIAKLGVNGEPQLWHPTGGTAVYWYTDTALSNARSQFATVAYNNRMYLLGGLTTSSTVLGSNTVQYADIKPNGVFTTWTTTGMQALTTARYGLTAHIYNGVLYALGGDATFSGSPVTTVEYSRLNSDGTMNTWVATSSIITSGRLTVGGSFSTIFGGYLYVNGGCTAVNASGYCTAIATDIQLASINADGSLSEFNTILGLTNDRFAHTMIAWQGGLYRLGGCRAQDASTGACTDTVLDVDYGVINAGGEASTVATSVASGVAPCSGAAPYSCDLASASVGNMLNASVIINGYLYIMGGCTNNACSSVSSGITYQAIGSDGTLQKPSACTGSYTDSYCVSSVTLPTAVGAPGVTIFNGRIYLVGGFTGGSVNTNINYVSVNNDGSLGAWSSTDTTTIGAEDVSYTFAYARANPASAGSNPGNLFLFGGCDAVTGVSCGNYTDSVYKCTISTTGVPAGCTKTGQTQIGTPTGATGTGLGAHAGAVYANYIYLMGGLAPGITDLTTVRYAKFDDSNNVVESDGAGTAAWTESPNAILVGRRRGAGFGYNGYLYVLGGYDGTDALADIEFARIEVSDGSIGAFDASSVSINKRWGLTAPVSNSYAYVIGGCIAGAAPTSCTSRTNTIQTFQIYNNDSGAIKSVTSLSDDTFAASTDRWGASSTVLNGYLYVAGGCTSATDCTTAEGDVQYAAISDVDGSIGSWASATKGIGDTGSGAQLRAWGKLVTAGGYLYYLGGQDSTSTNEQSTVYYASPTSGNITSNWAQASGGIGDTAGQVAQARTKFGVAVWDNRIYVVGGLDGSAAVTNTVYISPKIVAGAGGDMAADSWMSDADVPDIARFGGAMTAYANNLYLFGGNDGTNYLNDGQYATIGYKVGSIAQSGTAVTGTGTTWVSTQVGSLLQYTDGTTSTITAFTDATHITVNVSRTVSAGAVYTILDGSVSAWTFTTSLPGYVSQGEAFGANGYIYLVGGRSAATTCSPQTLIAPVSANTTIATGNNPTGVGEWFETNARYAGGRYGAAVAYFRGKVYTMGGGCSAPLSGAYSTGTTGQTTTTVTGVGTNWTNDYIGATISITGGSSATIVSVNSTTSLTVNVSQSLTAGRAYTITFARHTYGVIKSQPQVAIYSRMIDTDTDVFPTGWLMNGLDNSIGARWQVKYRSMHDINPTSGGSDSVLTTPPSTYTVQQNPNEDCGTSATMATMTTWGREFNYGDTTLGLVTPYTARNASLYSTGTITQSGTTVTGAGGASWTSDFKGGIITYLDGSTATIVSVDSTTQLTVSASKTVGSAQAYTIEGGNLNCARYFYFLVSIDASQTFGYPEDVNRGPTVSDLSLFFTSDPSKRLRHGKTFTGGEQQPLDTQCRVSGANPGGSQPNCPIP